MTIDDATDLMANLLTAGGPVPAEYQAAASAFDAVHRHDFADQEGVSKRIARVGPLDVLFQQYHDVFTSTSTMQGFARLKPHGYSGDFEIIERIYSRHVTSLSCLQRWDEFFHSGSAPAAVRNRGKVLSSLLLEYQPRSVLSVGCGPALDVKAALSCYKNIERLDLVDNDLSAINRARVNIASSPFSQGISSIRFLHKNALRIRADAQYDLIWCSGLFDYLNDKTTVFLTKRLLGLLKAGGVLCFGNFGFENPSRGYMEVVGDWFLIHRTVQVLERLAASAGMSPKSRIVVEDCGVNLFLIGGAC
jgi:SAM-dependent methyltransferase